MVRPKPPFARNVSQWNSSSESVPSAWLCRFVSGASMKRFFIAGPRANAIGSKSEVIGKAPYIAINSDGFSYGVPRRHPSATNPPLAGGSKFAKNSPLHKREVGVGTSSKNLFGSRFEIISTLPQTQVAPGAPAIPHSFPEPPKETP